MVIGSPVVQLGMVRLPKLLDLLNLDVDLCGQKQEHQGSDMTQVRAQKKSVPATNDSHDDYPTSTEPCLSAAKHDCFAILR